VREPILEGASLTAIEPVAFFPRKMPAEAGIQPPWRIAATTIPVARFRCGGRFFLAYAINGERRRSRIGKQDLVKTPSTYCFFSLDSST
jgi:hypothetical protein